MQSGVVVMLFLLSLLTAATTFGRKDSREREGKREKERERERESSVRVFHAPLFLLWFLSFFLRAVVGGKRGGGEESSSFRGGKKGRKHFGYRAGERET